MNFKRSFALISTATLLAFSCSVVHADSARQSKIKELDNQRSELAKKNGVTGYLGDGRWYSLVESENNIDTLKKQVEALKVPYSEKNTIKVSAAYVKALKDNFDFSKSEQERDQAEEILKSESAKMKTSYSVKEGSEHLKPQQETLLTLRPYRFSKAKRICP